MSARLAFVSPFFGAQAGGGAEAECRRTARELQRAGCSVEILSTCLYDLQHGLQVNAFAEGCQIEDGLTVRRFRVPPSRLDRFLELNARLLRGETLSREEENAFMAQHVTSPGLLRYLEREASRFDQVIFIPYLFGTSVFGWQLCAERAALIPCLHDEAYARMQLVGELFGGVQQVFFHVPSEAKLAASLYGDTMARATIVGEGVSTELPGDAKRFASKTGIDSPFVLCAGRKSGEKNTPLLIRHFERYLEAEGGDAKLVFIGPGHIETSRPDAIIDLGFVDAETKYDAMAAAHVLCQPSVNESFSLVLMEAWDLGTAALVHADCAVTREHVTRCGGGLYFDDEAAFAATLGRLLDDEPLRTTLGARGQNYVRENFAWPIVTQAYLDALALH